MSTKQIELTKDIVEKMLSSLPLTIAILDEERKIVFSNSFRVNKKQVSIEKFLGLRPGEALNCIHFLNSQKACGENENCRFCGTFNTIMKSQETNSVQKEESRITQLVKGKEKSYIFEVTSIPVKIDNQDFYIVTFFDISEKRRKRILERIFYHDIMNKLGSLKGFFELIKSEDYPEEKEFLLDMAESITGEMLNEIMGQRELSAAESGDLILDIDKVNASQLIKQAVTQLSSYESHRNKTIHIDIKNESVNLYTDRIILNRVIVNMLKNALEASSNDEVVTIGMNVLESGEKIKIWVHNQLYIDFVTQMQIFQRSFSTKGSDRGLGTYSMRILGESYLKGEVSFVSNENEGTTFWIELPKNYPVNEEENSTQ